MAPLLTILSVALIASVVSAFPAENSNNPAGNLIDGIVQSITGNYDSPPYTVVETYQVDRNSFEERAYEGGKKWACTKRTISSSDDQDGMFMTLFGYISGSNDQSVKIDMTVPVSTKVTPLDANSMEKEMCFYLDNNHQESPPNPTDPEVYLVTRPAMNVYTRVIGGWMNDNKMKAESTALDNMISAKGLQVLPNVYYINGYNSPWDFWNRRNEVWKVKA